MTKQNIIHILNSNKSTIKNYGIEAIGLFGSYARHEQTEASDIDIVVRFKKGQKSYRKFIRLNYFLEEILNKRVDLLTFKSLSQNFISLIEKDIQYVSLDS